MSERAAPAAPVRYLVTMTLELAQVRAIPALTGDMRPHVPAPAAPSPAELQPGVYSGFAPVPSGH